MKQHKHCKLIKAWADGAEIQYRSRIDWHNATPPYWEDSLDYRIKPKEFEMTKDDWKRVIDEGFYVRYNGVAEITKLNVILEPAACEVVREVGLRQPHFQGDKHPTGNVMVITNYGRGLIEGYTELASDANWESVTEYIVLGD